MDFAQLLVGVPKDIVFYALAGLFHCDLVPRFQNHFYGSFSSILLYVFVQFLDSFAFFCLFFPTLKYFGQNIVVMQLL